MRHQERQINKKRPASPLSWMKAAVLTALFILFPAFSAFPSDEPPLTLSTAVREALENNPLLKAGRMRVRAKEAAAASSGYLEDPSFKIELEDIPKDEPLNISPDNAMLTRYTLSQGFSFPGKLSLKERIALKESLKSASELKVMEIEVITGVKEAYYGYSFLTESIRITGEIKEILSFMSRVAETRYGTGQASQQDVIKVQLETTLLTNELITLEAERDVSIARLKSLMAGPQDSRLPRPEAALKDRFPFDPDEVVRKALAEGPEIRAMELELQAADLTVDLMQRDYYPDFMVGVAPVERDGRFESYDLMFQMNIPLWRGKYSGRVSSASAEAEAMRAMLSSEKNRKTFEVKEAAIKAEAADRVRTLYETSLIPQAELAFESASRNYQAGRIDLLTLLDSERALKRARIEGLSSVFDYYKRLSDLERAAGVLLFTDAGGAGGNTASGAAFAAPAAKRGMR